MELKHKVEGKIELTPKRTKLIKEYLKLQEEYQKLYNRCLVNKFSLYYEQEELDIDSLTEDQQRLLDSIVTEEQRKEALKDLPHHMVDYEMYLIAPYYIGNAKFRTDTCISELEDKTIELINERTKIEIKDYTLFIKN